MIIKTRFDVNDQAWAMNGLLPVCVTIKGIVVTCGGNSHHVKYHVEWGDPQDGDKWTDAFAEDRLYATPDDLLSDLRKRMEER